MDRLDWRATWEWYRFLFENTMLDAMLSFGSAVTFWEYDSSSQRYAITPAAVKSSSLRKGQTVRNNIKTCFRNDELK